MYILKLSSSFREGTSDPIYLGAQSLLLEDAGAVLGVLTPDWGTCRYPLLVPDIGRSTSVSTVIIMLIV